EGLNGELSVSRRGFQYDLESRSLAAGDVRVADLRLAGDGDRNTTRVLVSGLGYRGGEIRARGSYRDRGQQLAAEVSVHGIPVEELARRMGVPAGWQLAGRLTGTVTIDAA